MMEEDKIKKILSSLDRAKAPGDFLTQMNARLDLRKKVFFPMPLRLATVVTVLIIGFVVYRVVQPSQPIACRPPEGKLKVAAEAGARRMTAGSAAVPKAVPTKPEAEAPIEIALVLKGDGAAGEETLSEPGKMATDTAALAGMTGAGAKKEERSEPTKVDKIKYIISLVDGKVLDSTSEYITAEIPAEKKDSFLEMLSQLGELEKSPQLKIKTGRKTLRLGIQILNP